MKFKKILTTTMCGFLCAAMLMPSQVYAKTNKDVTGNSNGMYYALTWGDINKKGKAKPTAKTKNDIGSHNFYTGKKMTGQCIASKKIHTVL